MTPEKFKQEMREDMLREAHEDAQREHLMRYDWDYALKTVDINPEMTIKEFIKAIDTLNDYGWDVSATDLIDEV